MLWFKIGGSGDSGGSFIRSGRNRQFNWLGIRLGARVVTRRSRGFRNSRNEFLRRIMCGIIIVQLQETCWRPVARVCFVEFACAVSASFNAYARVLDVSVAFRTGNPQVGFSHTVPAPPNTVPVAGTTHTRPKNHAVSHGILDTCGYVLLKYCKYMYIKYEKN